MNTIVVKNDMLNRIRVINGLSVRALANKSSLNPVTINKIELKKSNPTPSTAKKICEALGVEFDEVFEITS